MVGTFHTDRDREVGTDICHIGQVAHNDSQGDSHREGVGSRTDRNKAEDGSSFESCFASYSGLFGLLPRPDFQLYNCLYLSGACYN